MLFLLNQKKENTRINNKYNIMLCKTNIIDYYKQFLKIIKNNITSKNHLAE